jgi:hypothetical protein
MSDPGGSVLPLYAEIDRLRFLEETRLEARDRLAAIIVAYDEALKDAQTKIPTPLHAAIEIARGAL